MLSCLWDGAHKISLAANWKDIIKNHLNNERKCAVAIAWVTLSNEQKYIFHMHHPTNRILHTTASVSPAAEHWLEWKITQ